MKKRIVAGFLAVVMTVFAIGGCGSSADSDTAAQKSETGSSTETDEGTVLRVAGQSNNVLFAPIALAYHLGYLEEELDSIGVDLEWSVFASGPLANEAVASGEADISYMCDLPAIIAKSSGMEIEVVEGLGYGEKTTGLLVAADSDIESVADLKGKTVGYLVGSFNQHLLALLLAEEGMTLDDVETINLGNEDHETALISGEIDASVTCAPNLTKFITDGEVRLIADGTGIKKSNTIVYALSSYAEEHPLVMEALIRATDRAIEYIEEDPDAAIAFLAEAENIDEEILSQVVQGQVFATDLTDDDITEIESVKDFSVEYDIIANDFDIDDFINTTYLESVHE